MHRPDNNRLARDAGPATASPPAAPIIEGELPRVMVARAGDHPDIHRLLLAVFQGPSSSEFHALHDEPLYEPSDRLLVKCGPRTVSHVHLTKRVVHLGSLLVPTSGLAHLATMPGYHDRGYASTLLARADRQMVKDGAVLGMIRTRHPRFMLRAGWGVCGRHCYSLASPRDILSQLRTGHTEPTVFGSDERPLNIRIWRRVEQAALVRLYGQDSIGRFGPLVRSEAHWQWLISRGAFDRIYVAMDGPDRSDLHECNRSIVGYAVMNEHRLLELVTSPTHPSAGVQLLVRACGDAIERDHHTLRLDAPPDDPAHQLFTAAGGGYVHDESDRGEVFLVKLWDPIRLLSMLGNQLHARAKAAALPRPAKLGLRLGGETYRLVLSGRSVRVRPGKLGRSYLACEVPAFTQLILGHLTVREGVETGRLEASTRVAEQMAAVLFPPLPLWRPPLDDLPAAR